MKKRPRFLAWLALVTFIFSINPWAINHALAADPVVSKVYIERTDNEVLEAVKGVIELEGQNLKDVAVRVRTTGGGGSKVLGVDLGSRTVNDAAYVKFQLTGNEMKSIIWIDGLAVGSGVIAVDQVNMPSISSVQPAVVYSQSANPEGTITIGGSYLNADTLSFGNGTMDGAKTFAPDGTSITVKSITGDTGLHDIIFTRERSPGGIPLTFRKLYQNQFRVVDELNIPGLVMYPNTGVPTKTTVYFQAPALPKCSVFFLRNGSDPYYLTNMGTNHEYITPETGDDLIKVKVPSLTPGTYQVVLTNYLTNPPAGIDLRSLVTRQLLVDNFIIVASVNAAELVSVTPASGPKLSPVTLVGNNLDELHIDNLSETGANAMALNLTDSSTQLEVNYGENWQYSPGGASINVTVKRYIRTIIGNAATFQATGQQQLIENNYDTLRVITGNMNDTEIDADPTMDVVLDIRTVLEEKTNPANKYEFREQAVKENGFTYIKSYTEPFINQATPDKIQVVSNKTKEGIYIGITGGSFMVTKTTGAGGQQVILYPLIALGDSILLSRDGNDPTNVFNKPYGDAGRALIPEASVEVYNNNILVDGSTGNDTGNRILIRIPAGLSVIPTEIDILTYVQITNPMKNTPGYGYPIRKPDLIQYVTVSSSQTPTISSIIPSVVSTEGASGVKINGQNFANGVHLYLEDQMIPCQRNAAGTQLTFNAPPWKQGVTSLLVANPEGGQASVEIIYVTSQAKPTITSVSPPQGTVNTQVTISGTVFMSPDPTGDESILGTYRLMGTRVRFGDRDINDYNPSGLAAYTSPATDLILTASGLADYYYSVFLKQAPGHYYIFKYNDQGQVILTDGIEEYTISGMVAIDEAGNSYTVAATQSQVTLTGPSTITLALYTPYQVNAQGVITGNRVKVTDNGKSIYATVPSLSIGTYDVTVVNPDMNTATLANAFTFSLPSNIPVIDSGGIQPNQGSVRGGYIIHITGSNFQNNGTSKSRVFINSIEVAAGDTVVGLDGKSIDVKVPAFPGDMLRDWGTDHKSVPVAILNPDGGSIGVEDGFMYIVPASQPVINTLSKTSGNAAGGDTINITGLDYRYYEPYVDTNGNFQHDAAESFTDLNGDGLWTDYSSRGNTTGLSANDLKVLPKVYFGNQQASITSFGSGYIVIVTPPASTGSVEVYLINNDYGISNKVNYNYQSSNPQIGSIVPAIGNKSGNESIIIKGSGFANTSQVRFGDLSNLNNPEAGMIVGGDVPQFTIAGGMTVQYQAPNLTFTIDQGGKQYTHVFTYQNWGTELFDMSQLKAGVDSFPGFEKVKVYVKDGRLIAERGYAPQVQCVDEATLNVTTASYYTIGQVTLRVVNPDGGIASGQFRYTNPSTTPLINKITRDGKDPGTGTLNGNPVRVLQVNYKGGAAMVIQGSGFLDQAAIQIGGIVDISPQTATYTLPTQIAFTMPAVPETAVGPLLKVVISNEDGGIAASDTSPDGALYIQFTKGESSPEITKIDPAQGPAKGGTWVTISGKDLRQQMTGYPGNLTVSFGTTPATTVEVVDYYTVRALTPAHEAGIVEVTIENPDGEVSNSIDYKYISNPTVSQVTITSSSTAAETISVKGGQEVTITGTGFAAGCKVVFSPVLEAAASGSGSALVYLVATKTVNGKSSSVLDPYTLKSGNDGIEITVVDATTIRVKTPSGKLDTKGLMVINSDGGASPLFENITFGLPQLNAPSGVSAVLVRDSHHGTDRFIKVQWNKVEGATAYEIYVVKGDKTHFIGSSINLSLIYEDLEPNTSYKFIVKAVGDFGSSKPSAESEWVHTGGTVGPPDLDGGLGEKTEIVAKGSVAAVTIGRADGGQVVIDLTQPGMSACREVQINLPGSVVNGYSTNIKVVGRDFELEFTPQVFSGSGIDGSSGSGVRFRIYPGSGNTNVPGGNNLSPVYTLEASAFKGQNSSKINALNGNMYITMRYDSNKAAMRHLTKMNICWYDSFSGNWQPIIPGTGSYGRTAISHLGMYCIIGSRR